MLLFQSTAWSASTKDEIIALRGQVEDIQKELAEIKKLLQEGARAPAAPPAGQAAFRPTTASVAGAPYKGQVDAPVTLIEYSDYQCPFCARNYREVLPLLEKEYIETGKVKFVMRENPIPQLHKNAMNASMAALCAGDQGKYWEMHNVMFDNQRQLDVDNLKSFANDLGLDAAEFNDCLDSKKHEKQVQNDMADSNELGMSGTPGFLLGLTDSENPENVNLTVYIKGAKSIENFRASINSLLDSAK
jgi:protein-disulfide isomerase